MSFKADIIPNGNYSMGSSTSKWQINGHEEGIIELTIPLQSSDGRTIIINDSRITANHVVLNKIASDLVGYKIVPIN